MHDEEVYQRLLPAGLNEIHGQGKYIQNWAALFMSTR